MFNHSTFFIGLDMGHKHSHLCVLDQDGHMIEETRLPTNQAAFQRRFSSMSPGRVAMEVGTHSRWVSHLLRVLGHDVRVANARKLKLIYHNPRKGDHADAEILARLAEIPPPSLHAFRRAFAINMLSDLHTLAILMGHSNYTILQRYLKLDTGDTQAAHLRAGPVDHLL